MNKKDKKDKKKPSNSGNDKGITSRDPLYCDGDKIYYPLRRDKNKKDEEE